MNHNKDFIINKFFSAKLTQCLNGTNQCTYPDVLLSEKS